MLIDAHTHQEVQSVNSMRVYNCIIGKNQVPDGKFTAGIHPWYISEPVIQVEELKRIAANENCIGIGECGLDKVFNGALKQQTEVFVAQCQLASEINKPLIVHAVKSHFDCIKTVKQFHLEKVLFHGFNNRYTILEEIVKADYWVSFGAALLNKNSQAAALLREVKTERFLLETDDAAHRIEEIYTAAAQLLNISPEELEKQLENNFNQFFKA
jgi:TatD DNase family protein